MWKKKIIKCIWAKRYEFCVFVFVLKIRIIIRTFLCFVSNLYVIIITSCADFVRLIALYTHCTMILYEKKDEVNT